MAKNPKIKDPTEVALSAIQDALNIGDMPPSDDRSDSPRNSGLAPDFHGNDDPRFVRPPANDDRATIGAMLQVIQKGRPRRSAYTVATLFAGLWVIGGGILIFMFLPALEAMMGTEGSGILALVGLGLLFLAPLILFYAMASIAWRGQELSLIAQSMAHMAVRFSEPENVASDAMVNVGQAIRREIAAMGDGVERAIARAGELEALVSNEVSSLERAYSDNEQRIRGLLDDIAVQRDNLAGQAEQVRNAISSVQIDLRQDIALISDSIAARVDEVAQSITGALEERTDHITRAMSNAGDSIVIALGERGGDLLDRLEDASTQTAASVLDATERLTASLDFKTGHVHDEFADLADKVHDMLNERIDRVTASFEEKSNAIVDGISARTDQVHSNISAAGETLLARLDGASDDLTGRLEGVGDKLAERILASGDKASEALDVTVNTLVAKVVSQTESAHDVLTGQIASFDGLVRDQGAELAERFARDSSTLGALITRHVAEFDRTVKTYGSEIVERIGQHSSGLSDNLKTYETAFESRIGALDQSLGAKVTSFDETVAARLRNFEDSFDTRATSITTAIDSRTISITQAIDTRATSVTEAIDNRTAAITEAFDSRTAALAETIDSRANNLTGMVSARFQEMHDGLEMRFGAVVTDVAARVTQFETLLDHRVEAAAHRVTTSGQQAAEILALRAEELTQGIRSRVEDADRSLSGLMSDTSEAIQNSARTAQQSLLTLSSEVGTHLKATAGDVERTVQVAARDAENTMQLASNNASAQMRSSSADIERTVQAATREVETTLQLAATNASAQIQSSSAEIERTIAAATVSYGATIGNRVEAITDSVREQAERLTQLIDDKRGTLVHGLGAKSDEIAVTIGSATESALKSIESHGGAFTVAMMNNSSDLARQINTASEVAIGAVNKSLKEIELASRAAIDQSRQVATTTVTELQETSKILRTDTLALFERLREGNILLQEVLTGAHENLNSLERTLVGRVAEFVTTMNDVTARNGASTSALEQQLGVFNTSTAGALDNLGSLAAQFESHGQALAQAAALVDQSNASTERSVADRNTMLEQIINTIDMRTLDMDERLHRFTSLLDESLEAAESRARDIARVVAETAGASSSAVSRQFEAVRMAVEDERRQTSEAMSEIYDQGTREADAMFRQAADKFSAIVHGMKQMAGELHSELDATRAELRRGVLDMPQEAAESTAQMRKVIVDQIEALAELNRIVARHGNGLDVAPTRSRAREEEPMLVAAGHARQESRPAPRGPAPRDNSASALPPPDFGPAPRRTDAPSVAPANSEGWLSDMLNRADDTGRGNARAPSGNPLESLALDITRLVDRELAAEMWDRYQRGERKAFTKRLYTPGGQKAFDEVARKYRGDRAFKGTVDRYINEFEKLLDDISRDERGPAALRSQLTSETGLVYTLLAHAAGRLG